MKTKLEILESHHDSVFAKLLEEEINLTSLTQASIVTKPGDEFNKIQNLIVQKKNNIKVFEQVKKIIEEMIGKEKGGNENGKKV